jgi:hypothetical protein
LGIGDWFNPKIELSKENISKKEKYMNNILNNIFY